MVARRGSPEDAGSSMNGQDDPPRATIKAHSTSTQPPSPLRGGGADEAGVIFFGTAG
ncbi:MAG TPA: hypothetical protein VF844_19865 [Ktedonobacteraceae bacterium]